MDKQRFDKAIELINAAHVRYAHTIYPRCRCRSKFADKSRVNLAKTRELEDRSQRDGLTGAYNRSYFDSTIEREFIL
ncbi:hypothetical protein [Nitrosomonas sp.]|uniref:hypothetical protein n=1 Tax=Nitrosomonas sp. TaxID=42353 RepID=UPI0025F4763D|nr:hypothetical protein [Nitrosomonas sp.]